MESLIAIVTDQLHACKPLIVHIPVNNLASVTDVEMKRAKMNLVCILWCPPCSEKFFNGRTPDATKVS